MSAKNEGLYQLKNSPVWHCRFYVGKKLIRRTTGKTEEYQAQAVYQALRLASQVAPDTKERLAVDEVLGIYEQLRGQYLKGQKGYKGACKAISNFYKGAPWEELGNKASDYHMRHYIKQRLDQGVKPATINKEIGLLSAAANKAIEEGINIKNYAAGKKLKVPKTLYFWLTIEQSEALLEHAKPRAHFKSSPHLYDWTVIALGTGMRMSEILSLQVQSISLPQNEILLYHTKSEEPHRIPMTPAVREAILNRLKLAKLWQTNWLFYNPDTTTRLQSVMQPLKRAASRAGIPVSDRQTLGLRVHTTRHTVGSLLMQAGSRLEEVQDLLNHSDIRTTQKYAHHAPDARRGTVGKIPLLNK